MPQDWTPPTAPLQTGWTPPTEPVAAQPDFRVANEKDAQGNAVVSDAGSAWHWLNTPLAPQIQDAAKAIANFLDQPLMADQKLNDAIPGAGTVSATLRGALAGTVQGAGDLAASFTSPVGIALAIAGLGPESKAVKAVPALKRLFSLPAVQTLQRAVQGSAGAGFATQGAVDVVEGAGQGDLGQMGRGATELAAGGAGVATSLRPRLAPGVQPTATRSRLTPDEAASNAFAETNGIPLDPATATGSGALRAVQKRVSHTLGGEPAALDLMQQQQQGLTNAGQSIAGQIAKTPATPESGGAAVQDALQRVIEKHDATATSAYQRAELIVNNRRPQTRSVQPGAPIQSMQAPVDVRTVKAGIQPLYETLKREAELVPLQGAKARALVAMDRLMNGPDFAPLLDAERASSDLGALAGSPDVMRTPGQAAAAKAFGELRSAVDTTAAKTSPKLLQALQEGRAATKAKYAVNDIVESVREEPVQAFRQLTAPKDTAINLLRDVQRTAPDALPKVARGYLEQLLDQASERGRFDHADKLYAEWQKLGPETKRVLFPKPEIVARLDDFFLLAKRLSENPNPSGTAHVSKALDVVASIGTYPLAKLLYSPAGARALTRLMNVSRAIPPSAVSARAAAQRAALVEVATAARAAGVPWAPPKAAQDSTKE